jgi:hypothetical protein
LDSKDKKWWMELRRNRMNDVKAETGVRFWSHRFRTQQAS